MAGSDQERPSAGSSESRWDRFNHSHISFYTWATLYFTTPFLVIAVWLRNRTTDRGTVEPDELIIPPLIRLFIGIIGLITLAVSLLLFLQPDLRR